MLCVCICVCVLFLVIVEVRPASGHAAVAQNPVDRDSPEQHCVPE